MAKTIICGGVVLNSFQWQMLNLDAALTGKPSAAIAGQMKSKPQTAQAWLESSQREWHLSDGGYSRVVPNPETGALALTSNSREAVKQAWSRCIELRADVEAVLQAVIE